MKTKVYKFNKTMAVLWILLCATLALHAQGDGKFNIGNQTFNANQDYPSITGPGISGTISYEAHTKKLTLDNATIDVSGSDFGIRAEVSGFQIFVKGDCKVMTNSRTGIELKKTSWIAGLSPIDADRSSLYVESKGSHGIWLNSTDASLWFQDINAKVVGKTFGIVSEAAGSTKCNLYFWWNCVVEAKGPEKGSIADFDKLICNSGYPDLHIFSPEGAEFLSSGVPKKGVYHNGNLVKDWVKVGEAYDIWIAGQRAICYHGDHYKIPMTGPGITGSVIYDGGNNDLTLTNATISATGSDYGIRCSSKDDFWIFIHGSNNKVTAENVAAIRLEKTSFFYGSGSLTTQSTVADGILIANTNLTIKGGCSVTATGQYGIAGNGAYTENLTITQSTVKATGTHSSVSYLKSLTLNGVSITQPAGAAFSPTLHGVALNGALVNTEVVIEPSGSGMESLHTSGIRVWGDQEMLYINLPSPRNETIHIYNVSGQLVHAVEVQNATSLQIPLQANVYLVKVGNAVGKVVVNK